MAFVSLLIPQMDSGMKEKYTGNKTELPLGSASILTHLKQNGVDVRFNDFDFSGDLEEVLEGCDIVGINANAERRENAIILAEKVKQLIPSVKVVLGGTYISAEGGNGAPSMAEIVVENYPFIDYIVVGPGELGLFYLLNNQAPSKIISQAIHLNDLPTTDISLVNPENYFEAYREKNSSLGFKGVIPVLSGRGCFKAAIKGRCGFCSIPNVEEYTRKDIRDFWKEIEYYESVYGGGYIYSDKCDTFTQSLKWLKEVSKAKRSGLNVHLRGYERIDNLADERIVELLASLGFKQLQIGIDSADPHIINKMNKEIKSNQIGRAVINLKNHKIYPVFSVIYGFPGETIGSAQRTLDVVKFIDVELDGQFDIYASPCIPYPGTKLYYGAYRGELGSTAEEIVKGNFCYSIPKLIQETIPRTTDLTCEEVVGFVRKTFQFGRAKTDFSKSFGSE
ncbi:MAG: radical SAM protein [archaeon]